MAALAWLQNGRARSRCERYVCDAVRFDVDPSESAAIAQHGDGRGRVIAVGRHNVVVARRESCDLGAQVALGDGDDYDLTRVLGIAADRRQVDGAPPNPLPC